MTKHRLDEVWSGSAEAYQDHILALVSRTFALTTPQLPAGLRSVVGNAYLLCRVADTIEDEAGLDSQRKRQLLDAFVGVVAGSRPVAGFVAVLHPALSRSTSPAERDLVKNLDQVLRITASFNVTQRAAINRCLRIMTGGMHQFQSRAGLQGLADVSELDRYCYFVAGVVGEMLTELFCDFSADIALRRQALRELQVSFGQALQMVNILKDLWDDRSRGVVWYPRDVFARRGFDLATLAPGQCDAAFADGLRELIAVAHAHLRNALAYICLIPGHEIGIRTFCAWALQLAVLTLGNLHQRPHFASSDEIKVSRAALARVIALSNLTVGSNSLLTAQFNWLARGLPLASLGRPAAPAGVEMRATTAA